MPPPASNPHPLRPTAAELAADPEAARWARECAWVPGTGHCSNRDCSGACLFRPQLEAEAAQIIRHRRRRRAGQGPLADRNPRR